MRGILFTCFICFVSLTYAQGHDDWIAKINTIEDAKKYAKKHSDVIVSYVNAEKDRFLFDKVNTEDMEGHIGEVNTLFGRSTKFLKDTVLSMVDIQVIQFNNNDGEAETMEILRSQILKKLKSGETYWDMKKKYNHTSASFSSGPEMTDQVNKKYNINLDVYKKGSIIEVQSGDNIKAIIILKVESHDVPAFCAISYNAQS